MRSAPSHRRGTEAARHRRHDDARRGAHGGESETRAQCVPLVLHQCVNRTGRMSANLRRQTDPKANASLSRARLELPPSGPRFHDTWSHCCGRTLTIARDRHGFWLGGSPFDVRFAGVDVRFVGLKLDCSVLRHMRGLRSFDRDQLSLVTRRDVRLWILLSDLLRHKHARRDAPVKRTSKTKVIR